MDRRTFLKAAAVSGLASLGGAAPSVTAGEAMPFARVRPRDPAWPSQARWNSLFNAVGGRLVKLDDPLAACRAAPEGAACEAYFKEMRNPYFISENPALTETSGWVDAWNSAPSAYAVKAQSTADVVVAVNFARENNLRLVIKGGGHSYQGTSDAPDSLLIWTREMSGITLHDAFVPDGCDATHAPQPAVTVEAGARWLAVYDAVTTRGGRYVQGGGCTTVGVAGFIHGGGFGSFSKKYGLGAAGLLQAEIVTADGTVLIVNACNHPDLFWAIKGGGGGAFGVLTKLTLRTRELPTTFGAAFGTIKAASDTAFRGLIDKTLSFYADKLFNPYWGEQIAFGKDNSVHVAMVFQGLGQAEAESVWAPFASALASTKEISIERPIAFFAAPAQHFWDADYLRKVPGLIVQDDRPAAPLGNFFYVGDSGQVGFFIHGYKSAWLPASLLQESERQKLTDAVFAASRHWPVAFHFNKGLAGAAPEEIDAARDTAMNPAVLEAFALVIIAGHGPPAFLGIRGHEPDLPRARAAAQAIGRAFELLVTVAPGAGAYLSEADFFDPNWKTRYWDQISIAWLRSRSATTRTGSSSPITASAA
ncbi:FAD-binding oxidoreductase [Bradyrhizobium sp. ARR65]|uniref:FAD-binding oxidoreductase n=1 Tax=Bradyrhizobium sp. ARR65 TaxID=1040989 RepID=UPI000AEF270D|nr:FAD-binding oxidoreductase [Bradyrhizobium sp. ARR65]